MFDLFKEKFIYFLVSFWMLVFTYVILHIIHRGGDQKALDWAFNAFSAMLGALLGLIQGIRIGSTRNGDPKDSNGAANGSASKKE